MEQNKRALESPEWMSLGMSYESLSFSIKNLGGGCVTIRGGHGQWSAKN